MAGTDFAPSGKFWDGADRHDRLKDWERAFVDGWTTVATRVFSSDHDRTYFPTPITGGKRALDVAKKHGFKTIHDVKVNLPKEQFLKEVVLPNIAESKEQVEQYRAQHPHEPVIIPINLEGAVRAMEAEDQRMSEDGFMSYWLHTINAQIGKMVVPDGWALSNGTTEEILEATAIQAGYRDRPSAMSLVSVEDGHVIDLAERAEKVAEAVQMAVDANITAPAQKTALARLFHIHDEIQSGVITPDAADPSLFQYDAQRIEDLKAKWEPKLLSMVRDGINVKDLDDRYQQAALALMAEAPAAEPQAKATAQLKR